MAADSTDKDEGSGARKPQRKPLTIDLPAEAVERKTPAEAGEAGASADAAAASNASSEAEAAAFSTDSAAGEPEDQGLASPSHEENAAAESHRERDAPRQAAHPEPAAKADPSVAFVPLLVAAAMGGVLVALVVVLLARGGFFLPPADSEAPDLQAELTALKDDVAALKQAGTEDPVAPLRGEIAGLRQSVAELQDREPVPASDATALTDIEGRLSTLADDVAALKSAAPADTSSVTSEIATLRGEVESLSSQLDKVPSEDRVAAIEVKVDAESAKADATSAKVDAASEKIDAAAAKIDAAAALGPSVAADALSAALQAGRPFSAELAALRTLGVETTTLDALAPDAATGLPTLASLRARFESEIAAVDLAIPIPEGTSVMDRLMKSAEGLVQVRPAHPIEGADPSAIVTRIRAALDAGDLQTALSEWDALPEDAKTATADFQRDAAALRDANALVAKLRADALARLEAGR